ncbi:MULTISPECIES: antibiotic biosynthesis monooxygenase [Micromonospora]|uniref:Antibiotic biosynthesis monooxygenase n=1 Tax=Micromonospora solifontis TaxID=2487138 RepID=A0ABX9WKL5_9ACTN|nr:MULTISPECIES: antibiotic biosynthesis monooxygenase [Micromonospora]NES15433.1 antibiotic biosynthesis monooxygenase [Micromonospora sp. PPF5-17B]NES35821.1 antibiotic biosynthesis monooxygenase [Micromonospora solifontis]NES58027.1 antibiotic biosynthesis monooxygenase [Micromonospora sp. PPF5-6]RNM00298.1 antibiotic biosynthesis monooxygenase [Micromonospora solifontis]
MTTTQAAPVTVAVARRADPARTDEMVAWMRAGTALAESFPGFLGAGFVQSAPGSPEWHVMYRFADAETLRRWEESPQRTWWLSSAQGIVEHTRVERRTGIEGWFDPPVDHVVETFVADDAASAGPVAPPRWKQAVTIWLAFFPLSLTATLLTARFIAGVPLAVRTLLMTLCLTPLMTYLVLPWITRALQWWLHGQPAPWRR